MDLGRPRLDLESQRRLHRGRSRVMDCRRGLHGPVTVIRVVRLWDEVSRHCAKRFGLAGCSQTSLLFNQQSEATLHGSNGLFSDDKVVK